MRMMDPRRHRLWALLVLVPLVGACGAASPDAASPRISPGSSPSPTTLVSADAGAAGSGSPGGLLWDDFSYASASDMTANGWVLRSKSGWPGVKGAIFDSSTISVVDDPATSGNRLLQISASTDGTTTRQSQVCQQRKFLSGTYAARVFFNDAPTSGEDGDQVVETFYLISPYVKPFDPDYSEVDNEYLPNGGWGGPEQTFYVTTWHTVRIEPWSADNASQMTRGSLQGWHTLVIQIQSPETRYFLDGKLIATHGEHYYPRVPMSIDFNLWMIDGGLNAGGQRVYDEQVDWVYHRAGTVLSPDQVDAAVQKLRSSGSTFQDTVPSSGLDPTCDM
jgi:Glycosyl hydrolases family 16